MKLITLKGNHMNQRGGMNTPSRPLREVEAYWEALRTNGDIPYKAQVSPTGLETALPHIMMIERLAPGVTRFRFGGRIFHDLLGMSPERVPLTVLFASNCQRDFANAVEDVFQKPAILRAELVSKGAIGRPALTAQMLLLPLRDSNGDASHAFGALSFDGRLGRVPRQFTDMRLRETRLVLRHHYDSVGSDPQTVHEPSQVRFGHKNKGRPDSAGRPKLRVINGDKP